MEHLQKKEEQLLLQQQKLHQEDPKSEPSELEKGRIDVGDELARSKKEEKIEEENILGSPKEDTLPTQESSHDLRRELDAQKAETRALYSEVLELEKRNEESLVELRWVRRERDGLLEQKTEMERRLETVMEESASIVSSMIVVQTDFEERMERKERDGRIFRERALSILKNAGRMMGGVSGEIKEEEDGGSESAVNHAEEVVRKFAAGFQAIEQDFRNRVEKMEEMKRKVEFLKGCVEEEMKKRKRCL